MEESAVETTTPGDGAVRVEVVRLNPWERSIHAVAPVPAPVEPIWRVLTDYERLADFLPHLVLSRRLPHPTGKIRLEQIGAHRFLKFSFRARVVLDIEEHYPERIDFQAVEGDFVMFRGAWELRPQPDTTQLIYSVRLRPRLGLPVRLVENKIQQGVTVNLLALRRQVLAALAKPQPPDGSLTASPGPGMGIQA